MLVEKIQQRIEPWQQWAQAEPMRHKIAGALRLLDRDHDAVIVLMDLEARANPKHGVKVNRRHVRTFYDALPRKAGEDIEAHRERIRHSLLHMSENQLADVIAGLPEFVKYQPKPLALRLISDKAIANAMRDVIVVLSRFTTSIEAPCIAPQIPEQLLASLGTIKPGLAHS